MKLKPIHALWLIPLALVAIPGWRWLKSRDAAESPRIGVPVVAERPATGELEVVLSYPGNLAARGSGTSVAAATVAGSIALVAEGLGLGAPQAYAQLTADAGPVEPPDAVASGAVDPSGPLGVVIE